MKSAPLAALVAGIVLVGIGCSKAEDAPKPAAAGGATLTSPATYASINTLFQAQCIKCHGGGRGKGGLTLDTYANLMKGGKDGLAVVAGDPDKSLIISYLKGTMTPRMPAKAPPLADADIQAISDWIKAGAKES